LESCPQIASVRQALGFNLDPTTGDIDKSDREIVIEIATANHFVAPSQDAFEVLG